MPLLLASVAKPIAKYDCLKTPIVLGLESFEYSLFHLISLILFICAIIHTLSVNVIHRWARHFELSRSPHQKKQLSYEIGIQFLYFLAEVEVVFALWSIPLFFAIVAGFGWNTALDYFNTRDYTEALFVVVVMCLAATRPVIYIAEKALCRIAKALGNSLSAWWYTLLTLGPLLGSFITEIGAMALCSLLLSRKFYEYKPSTKLSYATLGLLFVNISVGGVLTNFASPAVLVLAHCWDWSNLYMLQTFGWKAVLGIVLSNGLYWFYFRKEFQELDRKIANNPIASTEENNAPIPSWVTLVHVLVIVWIVTVSHYPAIFIGSFLFFLGFHQATKTHQYPIRLTRPLFIGLFLAGLVIHGGLQGWWVVNILKEMSPWGVLGTSMLLTGFTDNTAISYLSSLIPYWGEVFQYALFSGIIAGGGLTVIANAPNPAGYVFLSRYFDRGISAVKLFLAALPPTLLLYLIYLVFGPLWPRLW